MNDQLKTPNPEVDDFFLEHLNKIYYAKTHLAERLPELADQAVLTDLKYAILETCEDVSKQIVRMEESMFCWKRNRPWRNAKTWLISLTAASMLFFSEAGTTCSATYPFCFICR